MNYILVGKNIIKILPEISTKNLEKDDLDSLISNTQNLMQAEFQQISDESLSMNAKLKQK